MLLLLLRARTARVCGRDEWSSSSSLRRTCARRDHTLAGALALDRTADSVHAYAMSIRLLMLRMRLRDISEHYMGGAMGAMRSLQSGLRLYYVYTLCKCARMLALFDHVANLTRTSEKSRFIVQPYLGTHVKL